jgi:hypothetical protein
MQINGMKVIASPYMGELVTDWSGCRSPARAMRRAKRGFPQRSRAVYRAKGQFLVDEARGVIYGHPEDVARLMAAVEKTAPPYPSIFPPGTFGSVLTKGLIV